MINANCPDKEKLSEYALGTLNDESVAGLEEHLRLCAACAHAMSELDARPDGFTAILRQTQVDSDAIYLKEDGYTQMLAGLSELNIGQLSGKRNVGSSHASSAVSASESLVGRQLGQYKLLGIVGRGGMGVVYKARHTQLEKLVAVKILSLERMDDLQMQLRFRREMKAAGTIVHPNVVHAMHADMADDMHYLVMELIDGVDLSALLKRHGHFSIGHASEMIRMAAVGLEQIHRASMVHRDIKPGNLMLARDGQVKILDLGLALLNPQYAISEGDLTSTGQMMGTVDYISPEQADNTHAVDHRADIYGLGATLFALLCGRAPFGGRKLSLMNKLSLLANESAPSIQDFCPNAPDGLAEIVAKMLARDPQQRYASAAEVALALIPYCDASGITDLLPTSLSPTELTSLGNNVDRDHDTIVMHSTDRVEQPAIESVTATKDLSNLNRKQWILFSAGLFLVLGGVFWLLRAGTNSTAAIAERPAAMDIPVTNNHASIVIDAPVEPTHTEPNPVDSSSSLGHLERLHQQPADAAVDSDGASAWSVFSANTDPELRTDAIHRACQVLPVALIVDRLLKEQTPSIRAGLLLALSEYDQSQVLDAARAMNLSFPERPAIESLTDRLLEWYVNDPDSEVHSCVEYLLRSWGQEDRMLELRPLLEQKLIPFDDGWYQPYHVSAMVIIPGPRTEQIGSTANEIGRYIARQQNEDLRSVTIPRSFAICSTEVTRLQFWRSREGYWDTPIPEEPDEPVNSVLWSRAAEFCNRLTILEGLDENQQCYFSVPVNGGVVWRQKPDALELTGYRLPTDEEWEIACRAGTSTSRFIGEGTQWLSKYSVFGSQKPEVLAVAGKKPNSFGLFDTLGNVTEWIHSDFEGTEDARGIRRMRGGSAWSKLNSLRSAARFYYPGAETTPKLGFRVARTIRQRPFQDEVSAELVNRVEIQVGPPVSTASIERFADTEFRPLLDNQILGFGNWDVRNTAIRRFRIRNTSDQPLRMSDLPWMNGAFVFDPAPPLAIDAGSTADFGIRMSAHRVGEHTHDLQFQWEGFSDSDFPSVRLHGYVQGPLPEVYGIGRFGNAPVTASFGTVPRGVQKLANDYLYSTLAMNRLNWKSSESLDRSCWKIYSVKFWFRIDWISRFESHWMRRPSAFWKGP